MKNLFKILIISILCICVYGCKCQKNVVKKEKKERTDNTDDLRDEQMLHYDQEMQQLNERN